MRDFQTIVVKVALIVALDLAMAPVVSAGAFDGSTTLLCAPIEAYECEPAGECARVSLETANLPQFIRVDFDKKMLSGGERTTPIQNLRNKDGKTILQGAEAGRGWSAVIDQETGRLSIALADTHAGFLVFGACTTP